MRIKTNITSLLIGAAFAVAAMMTMAAASSSTLSYGRFQLVAADGYIFKIDTSTGQVWRSILSNPSKEFLAPIIPIPASAKPELDK